MQQPIQHGQNMGPRKPVYRPVPSVAQSTPSPTPASGAGSASASSSSLAALVPSNTTIVLCLAALLSAGLLVRTLRPRCRPQANSRSGKRATVIQKIIAQQEATKAEDRAGKSGTASESRSRSNSLGRVRNLSASVAATSAAIVQGLSKLTTVTSNAIASTSNSKLDSDLAPTRSAGRTTQSGQNGKGSAIATEGKEDAFSTGVGKLLSVDTTGKKNRGKKGKGVGSTPSHGSSLAVSPLGSPARRASLQDAPLHSEPIPVFEVSTQTSFPFPLEEPTTTSASTPTPTASQRPFPLASSDASTSTDADRHPSPPTPPKPPPLALADATVQTSPGLDAPFVPLPLPPLPKPFDLHASFQSTPPVRPKSPIQSAYSHTSPPPSPSPSRRTSALPQTSPRIQQRSSASTGDYLSSTDPSSSNNSNSPSPVAARSRKQARKASAAAASTSQPIVVGMPRPPRSRDPTDESQTMEGEGSDQRKAALLRVDTSSSRLSSSPERSSKPPLPSENSKGKEKEYEVHSRKGSGSMSSGKGRSGVPPPIGIPTSPAAPVRQPSDQRRLSTSTSGNSGSAGSASTSPYLSHQILMTMTPPDAGRRKSASSTSGLAKCSPVVGEDDERFWRETEEDEREGKWQGGIMGLAIELDEGDRRRHNDSGSTGSRSRRGGSRDGRETTRSWSSTGGSSSPNLQSLSDSYFPVASTTALTSPESSPHPPNRQLLPLSSISNQRPWSLQTMAAQYTMIPHPSAHSTATTPQHIIPPPPPPPIPFPSQSYSQGNPRSARQPNGLSVPSGSSQQQQQQALQQQQAYAFYAHAQASYQHVIALQLQAQQHQQRQQQQLGQQHQQRVRQDSENSLSNGLTKAPPTPTGLVYPISGTSIPPPPPTPQSSQSMAHPSGWGSVPPSPGGPISSQFGMSTISPTSATFPSSASSSSYSHQQQLPSVQPGMHPYYLGSPATAYLSNYSMSSQMPPLGQRHSSSGGKRGSNGGGGGRDNEKMKSPRPGAERARSASAATLTTMSSITANGQVVSDATGWKVKVRTAEMEADRSAKELEIARWRLSVLEEEQRALELENQEALRALATRAMRAEARIKLLEEARIPDSSSASGSGSPATRPSSVTGSAELPSDALPLPLTSLDEADSLARDSPPGVKVHPLAYLDLDAVSFNARPSPNVRPAFVSSPSMRRKSGRNSGEWKSSRKSARRRSSNNGWLPTGAPFEDQSDDDIEILLDAPMRRKSIPRISSRRSSFLGDDFAYDQELDDDEMSNLDYDDVDSRSLRGESGLVGSLPAYLRASTIIASRPPSISDGASPRLGPTAINEDDLEPAERREEQGAAGLGEHDEEGEEDSFIIHSDAPQVLVSPSEEEHADTTPPRSFSSVAHSATSSETDATPRLLSLPSPPVEGTQEPVEKEQHQEEEEELREEPREERVEAEGAPEVEGITDTE